MAEIEYLDVLTDKGELCGKKLDRNEVHRLGLWHKVVHVWIANPYALITSLVADLTMLCPQQGSADYTKEAQDESELPFFVGHFCCRTLVRSSRVGSGNCVQTK